MIKNVKLAKEIVVMAEHKPGVFAAVASVLADRGISMTAVSAQAAGGVGLTAVEIGKRLGARVIASARGADRLDVARRAGADVLIDSEAPGLKDALRQEGGVDVVYDAVGGPAFDEALRACRPDGRLLAIGFASGSVPQVPANLLLVKNLTVSGFWYGGYDAHAPDLVASSMAKLLRWRAEGLIRPHVGHVLPLGTIALLLKRWRKLPYLLYAHGLDILLPQRSVRKKTLLKRIVKHASGLVSNSAFTREALLKLGARADAIAVVYPCPNLTETHVSDDRLEHLRRVHHLTDKRVILTVGRLVERKGHDQIIRALPAVRKRVPNATYLIVGNGPHRHQLQQLVNQYRLGEHVTFLDRVDETQLMACFEVCDVFAMPSRQIGPDVEGFGMVYLEAGLFGKPAVAGESGGATEAVLNDLTGLTVDETDTAQVAHALINLLTNRAYADRLGFQAMQRVLELFTWDRQVEKLLKLLER